MINDSVLCKSLEAFKSKVNLDFEMSKVVVNHRLLIITGNEQLEKESKFYMKIKNEPDVVAAVRKLKSDHIHMRKLQAKRTKP